MPTKGDGTRKPTPGDTATKGLGTSKAVLNTLRIVGEDEDLAFLKAAADVANGILTGIREIEDGEIDADFAALAMDACGLVYIVITLCEGILNEDGKIPDQIKVYSGGLTRNLEEIQGFVHKKTHRKLYQRILKHGSDEQKVQSYRDQLRSWQGKFGLKSESTIHDSLQDIIDEKLRKLDLEEHAARKAKGSSSRPKDFAATASPSLPIEKSLPTIVLPVDPKKEDPTATPKPANLQAEGNDRKPSIIKEEIDHEATRKERLEEERRRKKAERERWRKSEQDFIQLPEANSLDGDEITTPFLPKIHKPSLSQPILQLEEYNDVPKLVGREDKKIAEDLHYSTQKELEAEDERQVFLLAAKIQREWEAEEQGKDRAGVSSKTGVKTSTEAKASTEMGRTYPTHKLYPAINVQAIRD